MHIVCACVHSLTIKSFKISDLNPVEIYTLSLKSLKIIIVLISTLKRNNLKKKKKSFSKLLMIHNIISLVYSSEKYLK